MCSLFFLWLPFCYTPAMKAIRPIILALETATDLCSVALSVDNRIYTREKLGARVHTQSLVPMITALLDDARIVLRDIDAIAVGSGPGSFTGVRIGASLAQGLGFGLQKPIYPISTLAALAQGAKEAVGLSFDAKTLFVPLIDARLQEVYWGLYREGANGLACLKPEGLVKPEKLLEILPHDTPRVFFGTGLDAYRERIGLKSSDKCLPGILPHATGVLKCALASHRIGEKGNESYQFEPTYIRNHVAEIPK